MLSRRGRGRAWALATGLVAAAGVSSVAHADPTGLGNMENPTKGHTSDTYLAPRHAWVYENATGFRYNPLGLGNEFRTGYRYVILPRESAIFNPSALDLEAVSFVTPAFARVGPRFQIQPVAVLRLSASYEFIGTFSSFGVLQSFASPRDEFGPDTLDAGAEAGDARATVGQGSILTALLQAKVSLFAVRNTLLFEWAQMNLPAGRRLFYNPSRDILHQNGGWVMQNDLDGVLVFDLGFVAGARYSVVHGFYDRDLYGPGEPTQNPNGPHHRLGPVFLYTFYDRPGSQFNAPTLVLLGQWFMRHRYRTGVEVNTGVPQIILAFTFQGELWPGKLRKNRSPDAEDDDDEAETTHRRTPARF